MDGAARQPTVGDRVQLCYHDGSGCVGTWEEAEDGEVLRLNDGSPNRHVTGRVERLVLGHGVREVVRGP